MAGYIRFKAHSAIAMMMMMMMVMMMRRRTMMVMMMVTLSFIRFERCLWIYDDIETLVCSSVTEKQNK